MSQTRLEICPEESCTGCGACRNACAAGAVGVREGKFGFPYPVVDPALCNGCSACRDVCPVLHPLPLRRERAAYAWQMTPENPALLKSTSGGFFYAAASECIARGGSVYGCVFDESLRARHCRAVTLSELDGMHGSKYVESDLGTVYAEVRSDLEAGRTVLFTGLPCQVAGLKRFLGGKHDSLLTIDLVCNGVPSQRLFDAYLDHTERKMRAKITRFAFRDKRRYGWSHTTVIGYSRNGQEREKTIRERKKVSYYNAFGSLLFFRDACYNCPYTRRERVSDLTVGNFWGIETLTKLFDARLGVSFVLVNSEAGETAFNRVKEKGKYEEFSFDEIAAQNGALLHSAQIDFAKRNRILDAWTRGWGLLERRYLRRGFFYRWKLRLENLRRKLAGR